MASRIASASTAAANAAEVMTKPGGTGRPSAVMVARLAPLPPVSSTTWQRGAAKGSTSGSCGGGTGGSSVGRGGGGGNRGLSAGPGGGGAGRAGERRDGGRGRVRGR